MSKTLEDIFVGEFRKSTSNVGYKDIFKILLPQECNDWSVSGTDEFLVKGIKLNTYAGLNQKLVRRLPRGTVARKRVIDKATRTYKRDTKSGDYLYEEVEVPTGSMVVVSKVNLEVPYKDYAKHTVSTKDPNYGFGYIDFVQKKGSVEYLYIIPKIYLYLVHQTALVLSVKNMKNFSGMGYVTWTNGVIYLHVVPYSPTAQYIGSRVLKTGHGVNYDKDIQTILNFWQQSCIIPNISLCSLSSGGNLVLKPTAVGYDEYIPVDDLAIGDKEVYGSELEGNQGQE